MIRLLVFLSVAILVLLIWFAKPQTIDTDAADIQPMYWMVLERKANIEYLYFGEVGNREASLKVKTFKVKSGVQGKKPTPLPKLLGRDYWLIVKKKTSAENPETAPYFLTLDVPVGEETPYGPVPYIECEGQCDWEIPGYFGLHGVGGDLSKLSESDVGSSGCVRHNDEDITLLYKLLDPERENIRYYIEDV